MFERKCDLSFRINKRKSKCNSIIQTQQNTTTYKGFHDYRIILTVPSLAITISLPPHSLAVLYMCFNCSGDMVGLEGVVSGLGGDVIVHDDAFCFGLGR